MRAWWFTLCESAIAAMSTGSAPHAHSIVDSLPNGLAGPDRRYPGKSTTDRGHGPVCHGLELRGNVIGGKGPRQRLA